MELNEREAHCIARLLQGALFADMLDGCSYCKYTCGEKLPMLDEIRDRLTEETGVDLGVVDSGNLPHSDFPFGRFLKNSNEQAKQYYRDLFKYVCELK